jgi:hypothetical protein
MATDRTREIQAPLSSSACPQPVDLWRPNRRERATILARPADQRPTLTSWHSADGRTRYAYDGISIRKVQG